MHDALTLLLELLLVAAAVGFAARRLRVHYNIALVLAGVALGVSHVGPSIGLEPAVVLQLFLPILLFEAAITTDVRRLRENLLPIALLAVPGLLLSLLVSSLVLHTALALGWPLALLLGAMLSTTDTIAVIATFRKVHAPARLTSIVENESLFNDGTALVAFTAILGALERGGFEARQGALDLVWVSGVGLGAGLLVGHAVSLLVRHTDDHLMEILLTVVATYGSAVLAERLHASPILAVVAAGITIGSEGWRALTATGKVAIRSFWETAAFGVNSVVFLLIGLQVDIGSLRSAAPAIGWGFLALTLGRAASIYPLLALLRLRGEPVPYAWQHLLVWGNLKGSLSMALVLSLPAALPQRELLVAVVFGCALLTLTLQGLSLAPVARAFGLGRVGPTERRLEEEQGRLLAARAGQAELDHLQRLGLLPSGVFQRMRARYQGVAARSERELRNLLALHSHEEDRHTQALRRRLLTVERNALREAGNAGILSEEAAAALTAEVDRSLAELTAIEERS